MTIPMSQNPQIEALKPCPLCGGKAELWRAHPENPKLNAWIACADRCLVLTQEFESDEAAVAHWNSRASQEAAAPSEEPVAWRDLYDANVPMADGEIRMTAAEDVLAWLLIEKIGVPDDTTITPKQAQDTIVNVIDHLREYEEQSLASPAVAPVASVKGLTRDERLDAWASLRMIADAVGELFGPLASIESEDASLLRGPEFHHFAQGIVEALQRISSIITATKGGEAPWRDIPVTDDTLDYVSKYGGRCRDCADEFGICPGGLPCKLDERHAAIRHVLRAINYGMSHGFLSAQDTGGVAKP